MSGYDPKNDPARKPQRSKDPAWRFGYWPNLQNKDEVACTLCGGSVRGGIKRLKQHLTGGYGDAKLCSGVNIEVRREMAAYLDANKRKRPLVLDDEVVEVAKNEAAAAVQPSSGTTTKKRQASLQFMGVGNKTKPEGKTNKSIVEMLRKTLEEIVDERLSGSYQPTIVSSIKTKEEKHYVDTQWALFFYECGIPFNAAAAKQFQIAFEATAQYGSEYKPPTPYQLGDPLLQEAVKSTSTMREHGNIMAAHSCLMNEKKVEEIGKDKVVQVVTNNGANFKAVGKILMDRIPTIFGVHVLRIAWISFDWWSSYGGRAIELQKFARRVVSLCASSSGCACGCECALTWNLVDEAVGASQSLQGRNFPRAAHRRARNSAPMVDEAELGADSEENPDPFNDAD
ncbi:unnamed protein product [Miscanthus lutarioriparius]|uniref:DUF659 domain-containing protein n=1 Tax=Miscanthus lutarioriparius TaxID=422564 RepID=A0A811PKJ5_9POAL|nr:unnamed protein product [Miscanthus lutarioriparius]